MRKKAHKTSHDTENNKVGANSKKRYRLRRRNIVATGGIIFVISLLVAGSLVYFMNRSSNNEKLVVEAVANALTSRTLATRMTTSTETSEVSYQSVFEGRGGYTDGFTGSNNVTYSYKDRPDVTVKTNILQDEKGNTFIKYDGINNLQKSMRNQVQAAVKDSKISQEEVDKRIMKFDEQITTLTKNAGDKWINTTPINVKDKKNDVPLAGRCADEKMSDDAQKKNHQELAEIYQNHPFFTVEKDLGTKDGDRGFVVGTDTRLAQKFVEALRPTKFFKHFSDCGLGGLAVMSNLLQLLMQNGRVDAATGSISTEFWIDTQSHSLDKIIISVVQKVGQKQQSMKLEADIEYGVSVQVEAPKDAVPYEKAMPFLGTNGQPSPTRDPSMLFGR